METTNFKKDDNQELENPITNPETVESITETSESANDTFNTDNLEEKVVALEGEITEHLDKTNEVRADLGLPPEDAKNIPALKNKLSALANFTNYLKNTVKAATMAGIMLAGTSEVTAQTNKTVDKNPEKKELKDYISNLESAGINIDNKTKIGLIGPDGKFVTMTTEKARNLANQVKEDVDTEPDNSKKDEVKKTTEIQSLLSKLINKGVVPGTMTPKDFQALSKAEVDFLYKEYAKKIGALTPEQMKKALEGKTVLEEITIQNALKVTEDVKEFSKTLTPEQRSQEIKNIWKMEAQGKIKIGDSVTLSNGEVYVVKQYIPNTSKESGKGNASGSASASVDIKLAKDYFNN